MGNWWLEASSQQCSTHASHLVQSFCGKTSNHPGDSAPYRPDLAPCDFWLFPKLKSPLKGKRFQTISEIQQNTMGNWRWLGELYEVPRCLLWRGLRCHCPVYNVSCIFFNKCLYFSYYMAKYLLHRPHIFRERGREGKRGREHWCMRETLMGCLSHAPDRGLAFNPGMCPDGE